MLGSYEEELKKDRKRAKKISPKEDMNPSIPDQQPPFQSYQPPPYYWGQPPPQMPPYPYNPWQYNRPKRSVFTTVGITFGIIVMCIFWTAIFPYIFGTVLLIVVIVFASLGITFGSLGYSKKKEDLGLVALIISIVAIILSIIFWVFTHMPYYLDY